MALRASAPSPDAVLDLVAGIFARALQRADESEIPSDCRTRRRSTAVADPATAARKRGGANDAGGGPLPRGAP
jgi:hypothetical protein